MSVIVQQENLKSVTHRILSAMGCADEEADIVADHLVRSDLSGHESHGVGMLPLYVLFHSQGLLKPNTGPKLINDHGAILVYDGQRGFGQRTVREVIQTTIERTKSLGLAASAIRNCHHIGRVGTYGEMAMDAGLISIHFANVIDHAPFVAPYRGTDARFGTNPVCIAIPESYQEAPLLLDFATSRAAVGKARVAVNKEIPMDDGYLLDAKGQPTTDPNVMFEDPQGSLTAMGDHKGFGLAMFAEILASTLSGGDTIHPGNKRDGSIVNNILTIMLDPGKFGEMSHMRQEIKAYADYVTASPEQKRGLPVLVPGMPEFAHRQERTQNGIPLAPNSWKEILKSAETLGLDKNELLTLAGQAD